MKGLFTILLSLLSVYMLQADTIVGNNTQLSRADNINAMIDYIEAPAMVDLVPGILSVEVKQGLHMLAGEDAKWVSSKLWGNNGTEDLLAILMPKSFKATDAFSWGASIRYMSDGHVNDNGITVLDTVVYFKQITEETKAQNKARKDLGLSGIRFIGWADEPFYDPEEHVVYWPKEIAFEGRSDHFVNVSIQQFCREGYVNLNFIVSKKVFDELKAVIPVLISCIHIQDGQHYDDYNPKTDLKAPHELGASVRSKKLEWKRMIFDNITTVLMVSNLIILLVFVVIRLSKKKKLDTKG